MEKIRDDFEQWVLQNKELILFVKDVFDPFIRSGDCYIHERTQKLYESWCSGYQRANKRLTSKNESETQRLYDKFYFSYALNKQIPAAYAIVSHFGQFVLDHEMKTAVEQVLTEIIKKRINEIEEETK